jgi:hypothetical protein
MTPDTFAHSISGKAARALLTMVCSVAEPYPSVFQPLKALSNSNKSS